MADKSELFAKIWALIEALLNAIKDLFANAAADAGKTEE